MRSMSPITRIRGVQPLKGFVVHLEFTDGSARDVDLEPYLRGPIFAQIRVNAEVFRSLHVDPGAGTIVWDNGADIDPDVLYDRREPAWAESPRETV
jgi:Protein of unknown function (DUF2442)